MTTTFTWYKAWLGRVEPIEIVGTTAKMVKLPGGRKEAMDTDWYHIRPTREEAKAQLISDCEANLRSAKKRLAYAETQLAEALAA